MVSIAGATQAVPLIETYASIGAAVAQAQAAIAAQATIQVVSCEATIAGTEQNLTASTPFSVADTATLLNSMITIWQAQQTALAAQIAALS